MLTFSERLSPVDTSSIEAFFYLPLTAEERSRSRFSLPDVDGRSLSFRLPRGTILHDGDYLRSEGGDIAKIVAKPEPVITVTSPNPHLLLKAAYHLGNRHVPLEVAPAYLRFSPDTVLESMLTGLGLHLTPEITPFYPEVGAYHHH